MTDHASSASRGEFLWKPTEQEIAQSNLTGYMHWLDAKRGLKFADYQDLQKWSVGDLETFWKTIVEFFEVRFHQPAARALSSYDLPGAH